MLPVVHIGADDTCREALTGWHDAGLLRWYDTAADAQIELAELLAGAVVEDAQGADTDTPAVGQDSEGRWACTVIYGPRTWGAIATGQGQQLAHTGWTLVAGPGVVADSALPPSQREDAPAPVGTVRMVQQVAAVLRAQAVFDTANAGAPSTILRMLQGRERP